MRPRTRLPGIAAHAPGLGGTRVGRATAWTLTLAFLATIYTIPLADGLRGGWTDAIGVWRAGIERIAESMRQLPSSPLGTITGWNRELLTTIDASETDLENASVLAEWIRPAGTDFMLSVFGAGSEEAYRGRDGWLFYRPDVDFVLTRALDARLAQDPHPRPVGIIADFARQLAARGIRLIIIPVPGKISIEPERFARGAAADADGPLLPDGFADWKKALDTKFAEVFSDPALAEFAPVLFDPGELLRRRAVATGEPQFLRTDSHWTPEAMEAVASAVAELLGPSGEAGMEEWKARKLAIEGVGDTAAMLGLPERSRWLAPQRVTINQVLEANGGPWRPDRGAGLLVLGDSYTNIFSSGALGWGESAGFAEQLARHTGRPVDRMVRNDGGASATREMLAAAVARDPERLAGKQTIIWQFALRELAFGEWKAVELPTTEVAPPAGFVQVAPGELLEVTGTIAAVAEIPRAGATPYADFLTAFHLTDVEGPGIRGGQALVFAFTMRGHELTPAARLREGQQVLTVLANWEEREPELGGLNRGEPDDPDLIFEIPLFAEKIEPARNAP